MAFPSDYIRNTFPLQKIRFRCAANIVIATPPIALAEMVRRKRKHSWRAAINQQILNRRFAGTKAQRQQDFRIAGRSEHAYPRLPWFVHYRRSGLSDSGCMPSRCRHKNTTNVGGISVVLVSLHLRHVLHVTEPKHSSPNRAARTIEMQTETNTTATHVAANAFDNVTGCHG